MMSVSIESRARASFPIVRFLQSYLPLPALRWLLKLGMARVQLNADVTRQTISADGVSCEWLHNPDNLSGKVMLYLHGGGFVLGLTPLHLQMGAYLLRKMNVRILMVDYRLAPEHPFPSALGDCTTVYSWLLKQGYSARDIVIAGDSAGGNLVITSLMKMRDGGVPLPAAVACLSPVTDLTSKGGVDNRFKDPILPHKAMKFYTESYVGPNDAHIPLISPVFGDLRGLPPMLVHAGEYEILRQDAVRIASLAKDAGVKVRLAIYPHMWHVWQLYLTLPQAVQSLNDIAQFLLLHLDHPEHQTTQRG